MLSAMYADGELQWQHLSVLMRDSPFFKTTSVEQDKTAVPKTMKSPPEDI